MMAIRAPGVFEGSDHDSAAIAHASPVRMRDHVFQKAVLAAVPKKVGRRKK
jgi:hypothetical protein